MKTIRRSWPAVAAFFLLSLTIGIARVTCIRLTSEHVADTTDLGRFRAFDRWDQRGRILIVHYSLSGSVGRASRSELGLIRDDWLSIIERARVAGCGLLSGW